MGQRKGNYRPAPAQSPWIQHSQQRPRQLLSPSYAVSAMVGGRPHQYKSEKGNTGSQLRQPEHIDHLGAAGLGLRKLLPTCCFGTFSSNGANLENWAVTSETEPCEHPEACIRGSPGRSSGGPACAAGA